MTARSMSTQSEIARQGCAPGFPTGASGIFAGLRVKAPMSGMLNLEDRNRPIRKGPHRLSPAKTLHTVGTTGFEPATP
jgi:hypothetical protein